MDLRIEFNKGLENNRIPISLNYLRWPPHLQASLLDLETRQKYVDEILPYGEQWLKYYSSDKYARLYLEEWDQLNRWCDYLITEPTQIKFRKDFVNYIKAYDIRRDKNFKETFKEFAHLLEEWDV